jgi:hypothetical protein
MAADLFLDGHLHSGARHLVDYLELVVDYLHVHLQPASRSSWIMNYCTTEHLTCSEPAPGQLK